MRTVVHPGPVSKTRIDIAPCTGREILVTLEAGIPLEEAVAKATQDFDSAYLEFAGAKVSALDYVIPAHAPDARHVAWYSEVHSFGGPGVIDRIGMIVGKHQGASFLHGHGLWTPDGGMQAMGHILAPRTVLAEPVTARGIGLSAAQFDRLPDEETNFELFQIRQIDTGDTHAAVRLRPNQDFTTALDEACATLGWDAARVQGVGSLIGAQFEDGEVLDSHATEFLVTDAVAGEPGETPEILIVGIDGRKVLSGRVTRGENAVLITAELILSRVDTR